MAKYYSTKTYNNDRGLSCCYRQWRSSHSHCRFLHGYSIGVKIVFGCTELDERNWVMDFGGLGPFKEWLENMFDHTVVIAADDPERESFEKLDSENLLQLRVLEDGVGCEKFAELIFNTLAEMIQFQVSNGTALNPTVFVESVEVFEHGANSSIYSRT